MQAMSAVDAEEFARKLSVVEVMQFISKELRAIDAASGRRYWRALRSPDATTYDEEMAESVLDQAERVIAARERMASC